MTHTPVDLTDEQRANLNAAAPDLLNLVERAHQIIGLDYADWHESARAAITKATGYSSALAALNAETNEMVALTNQRHG